MSFHIVRSVKAYTPINITSDSIIFSFFPPYNSFLLCDKQYIKVPLRLTFTGYVVTTCESFTPMTSLLNSNHDGPRQSTFSRILDTVSFGINSSEFRGTSKREEKPKLPISIDSSYTIVNNYRVKPSIGEGTIATAVVDMAISEPLYLWRDSFGSPCNSTYYRDVNSIDLSLIFYNTMGTKLWTHDGVTPVYETNKGSVFSHIISIKVEIPDDDFVYRDFSYKNHKPQMFIEYII